MVIAAWVASLIGLMLVYVTLLACGMKTAPEDMSAVNVVFLSVLPLIAFFIVTINLYKAIVKNQYLRGIIFNFPPAITVVVTFFIIIFAYNPTSIHWLTRAGVSLDTETYRPEKLQLSVSLEIRYGQDEPGEGLIKIESPNLKEPIYTSDTVLFSNKDIQSMWVDGPDINEKYNIVIEFKKNIQSHVKQLSMQHIGNMWAIFIDGELLISPIVMSRLQDQVLISTNISLQEAQKLLNHLAGY